MCLLYCLPQPRKLKSVGYQTYMVGKWHQGLSSAATTPLGRGFDKSFGYLGGGEDHVTQKINLGPKAPIDLWNNDHPDPRNGTYDTFTYWSVLDGYLDAHNTSQPFFLYLAMHNVHEPYQVPQRFKDLYPASAFCELRRTLQGMVSVADELVGNLTTKLQGLDLWRNTVLVFASDNGGDPTVGANAPFKGGKATLFEGGIRSATFVYSELLPATARGTNVTHMTHISDWYRTFALLAGADAEDNHPGVFPVDGVDLWPVITGEDPAPPRGTVIIGHEFEWAGNMTGAVIKGDWKLIVGGQAYSDYRSAMYPCVPATPAPNCDPNCLFNLGKDPFEHRDLARSNDPAATAALKALLELYRSQTNLFQNTTADFAGFDNAVHSRYRGYIGPWLDPV